MVLSGEVGTVSVEWRGQIVGTQRVKDFQVMGVDPGTHTGIAVVTVQDLSVTSVFVDQCQGSWDDGWLESAVHVIETAESWGMSEIVIERFILGHGDPTSGGSSDVEGLSAHGVGCMIKALYSGDVVWQTPAERKTVKKAQVDRWMPPRVRGNTAHKRDALMHALLRVRKLGGSISSV